MSILFIDLVGSTALAEKLDPEPLRLLLDRYFAVVAERVAEHGGAVEKFIGDAVMAVFGAAVSHEDDALRAVRATAEALTALEELSAGLANSYQVRLEARCGICTGEVMTIMSADGSFRVIGDSVNTASRLQGAASAGEIFIDAATAELVHAAVGLMPLPPLRLKGKAQPVAAWRVTGSQPTDADPAHANRVPLIGREHELAELHRSLERVTRLRQPALVSLLGPQGVGKSRLVREFIAGTDTSDPWVLSGSCPAYGRSITYAPLADMLRSPLGGWSELASLLDSADDAGRRARRSLSSIMPGDPGCPAGQVGVDDISWAVRRLLTELGGIRPVIVVWEDVQWAEPTLLELIDNVARCLADVPVLQLCLSREDMLENEEFRSDPLPSALMIDLGPLTPEHCVELTAALAARREVQAHDQDVMCQRVAQDCEGIPLFAELMFDLLAETGSGVKIPTTIAALLAARLDQLPEDEGRLLDVASVIGREFSGGILRRMSEGDGVPGAMVTVVMTRLVGRRIIERVDADSYRFAQSLLRDVAYGLTPKTHRERWHLFLADWFGHAPSTAEGGEDGQLAMAHHVEVAAQLRRQLVPGDQSLPALADRAAQFLIEEGTKALRRRDLRGAATLLERGRGLMGADDPMRTLVALYISDSWLFLSDPDRAMAVLSSQPEAPGSDPQHQAVCRIQRCIVEFRLGLARPTETAAEASEIVSQLGRGEGFDRAWCRLFQLQAYLNLAAERTAQAEADFRRALDRARSISDVYEEERLMGAICELAQWTPTPVQDGLSLCAELAVRFAFNRTLLIPVLLTQARLSALANDLPGARAALATAREDASELGLDLASIAIAAVSGLVEALAEEHKLAEAHYRRSHALLLEVGHARDALNYGVLAARELFERGEVEPSRVALDHAFAVAGTASADLRTQIISTALKARVASVAGHHQRAISLAREAARMGERTDDLCLQGDALFDLAVVLNRAGRFRPAATAARSAAQLYCDRGATRLKNRIDRWLASGGGVPEESRVT